MPGQLARRAVLTSVVNDSDGYSLGYSALAPSEAAGAGY